jgi:hypothetical protein
MLMAEPDESTTPEDGKRSPAKPRGARFPVLTLPAAVDIVHAAGQHGADHHINAFAGYAGHKTTNSGGFRGKLAAIKEWKLISVNGERVTLTDLGKKFARSHEPLSEKDALQESFLGCKIFTKFLEEMPKGKSQAIDHLATRASLDHSVNSDTKTAFVKSFTASAVAAGLATSEDDGKSFVFKAPTELGDEDVAHGDEDEVPTEPEVDSRVTAPAPRRTAKIDAASTAVVRQVWPIDGGEVVLMVSSSKPIPADAFTLIADAVSAAATLASHLAATDKQEDGDGDAA